MLAAQHPRWAGLPLTPVASAGTDNALFRLGDDLVVRLPKEARAASQGVKEQAWLPRLSTQLPLAIPAPVATGAPGAGFPWGWSVCRWLDGRDAWTTPPDDPIHTGEALGAFVAALQRIDAAGGPASGEQNSWRGVPLRILDRTARRSIAGIADLLDAERLTAIWAAALAAPRHAGPPTWIHGDLHPGNLLVGDGRLTAVIDFGLLGVGDPAADLMAAWSVVPAEGRQAFRAAVEPDAAAWTRARGWAVYAGAVALSYYRERNPTLAAISRRTLEAVLAD
ncbi:aminoglycoside phosphotransferase family protein [Caulobacter mirabilis]|uniref:Phosphotransferase n=1 Tax=Caulobacter mirabilis TaxID=69666 RepID=A0A2D2AWJ4_9CAUL|nr:aminoglycoside phosphotransferase family protein [Caulobacter mirabilis]ATQ42382.1 phosphotransferase [Caulobacter mirabilis]